MKSPHKFESKGGEHFSVKFQKYNSELRFMDSWYKITYMDRNESLLIDTNMWFKSFPYLNWVCLNETTQGINKYWNNLFYSCLFFLISHLFFSSLINFLISASKFLKNIPYCRALGQLCDRLSLVGSLVYIFTLYSIYSPHISCKYSFSLKFLNRLLISYFQDSFSQLKPCPVNCAIWCHPKLYGVTHILHK